MNEYIYKPDKCWQTCQFLTIYSIVEANPLTCSFEKGSSRADL